MKTFSVDQLLVRVYPTNSELSQNAAKIAHNYLKSTLDTQGYGTIILATGNSQIQFLQALVTFGDLDWSKITCFHLDEYLGIAESHRASFRRYLREKVEKIVRPRYFHYLQGNTLEPLQECDRYSKLLMAQPIDLCLLGVGDNGHLAFNEPTVANFQDPYPVKLVQLDRQCRQQQVNQGHFPHLEAVPQYAFTLTIPMIGDSKRILCLAPQKHKAEVIKTALQGEISPHCPASWLRTQPQATLFLDTDSAALI